MDERESLCFLVEYCEGKHFDGCFGRFAYFSDSNGFEKNNCVGIWWRWVIFGGELFGDFVEIVDFIIEDKNEVFWFWYGGLAFFRSRRDYGQALMGKVKIGFRV